MPSIKKALTREEITEAIARHVLYLNQIDEGVLRNRTKVVISFYPENGRLPDAAIVTISQRETNWTP